MRVLAPAALSLLAAAALVAPPDAQGQSGGPAPRGAEAQRAELDRLFEALRTAPDEASAMLAEAQIRAVWGQAVSPAAGLLLRRGIRNMEAGITDEAVEDFDAAVTLQPDAAEAWLLRAQALARLGDAGAAARDLQEALRLEPRHFGALLQLSVLQEERGDFAGAVRSLEAALELHPKMPGGEARLRELRRKAFGDVT